MTVNDELKRAGVPVQPEILQSQIWIEALRGLGYHFRLNLCDDSIEVNQVGTKLSDVIMAEIRTQMFDRGVKAGTLKRIEDAYMTEAKRNAYHPVKDYFNSLVGKWDGVDRLSELCQKIRSDSGIVEYADGRRTPLHAVYFGRWMIGVVAKALDGLQNPLLGLDGPQGIGKSLLARWLCSMNPDWFIEGPIDPADKDCDIRLMTRLIWEVSELDATTRRADVAALKAFITKGTVTVRKAYGRHDISKPALCSMIGTINNTSSGFLTDETGNRRFMIVRITHIDWSYRQIDLDQLWAQIVSLYLDSGMQPELTSEEKNAQKETNKTYESPSPVEDWARLYFVVTDEPNDILTVGAALNHLAEKSVRLHGPERLQGMEIARAFTKMGATKRHTERGNIWVGIVVKH